MENYKYLKITNSLLFISIIFYFLYSKKNLIETSLVTSLYVTIFFTQIFWSNPIKNSLVHKIDAIVAKMVIFSFIFYTIFLKLITIYLIVSYWFVLIFIGISFYLSNYYSSQIWCCNKHIISHGCLHIFCFIATFYAFI